MQLQEKELMLVSNKGYYCLVTILPPLWIVVWLMILLPSAYSAPSIPTHPPFAGNEPNWMASPEETIPGCPPGLEYLTKIDQLLVHQQVELFESTYMLV